MDEPPVAKLALHLKFAPNKSKQVSGIATADFQLHQTMSLSSLQKMNNDTPYLMVPINSIMQTYDAHEGKFSFRKGLL